MKIETAVAIAQLLSFAVLLPMSAFRTWRKLDKRLTEQDKQLVRINYQLWENGGHSMKDQVNKLVTDVAVLKVSKN
jgi:sensor domain CHASE-containing protein